MSPAVTVVGSLNRDLVVSVERLPGRGETALGQHAVHGPGGKGANQAAAAGALSTGVAMVGRVGEDGRDLLDDLDRRGVDTSAVAVTAGVPTGTATVAVDPGGDNLIVVAPGANAEVTPQDVRIPAVRDAGVVLAQLEIPVPAVLAAALHARGLVVLNPAPVQSIPADLLARADVLVPNEWELAQLAGLPPHRRDPDELAALARRVTERDVIVTIGARGALMVPASGGPTVIAAPHVRTVDTTGAGDCFCGALCVALSRGADLLDATRYAVVAAALSTTAPGARGGLPTDDEVRRHVEWCDIG